MATTLHGRAEDLALLDETLAAAHGGRGRAVFFTGEPGIGKSTLLAEARGRAPSDALVVAGAAWESGGAPSYWPWQQVLRDVAAALGKHVCSLPGAERIAALVSEWSAKPLATSTQALPSMVAAPAPAGGDAADMAASRFALLDAVVRALVAVAQERPLVVLLDDLHAADVPSLDLLVMLARELPRARIALIAAWREGELAVHTDAAQRLGRAARFGMVQPLRRLTLDEVSGWVGAEANAVFAATEGNPLFVEESLRTPRGSLARGITAAIADHLALASERSREVLAVASVLGREVDARAVAALASTDVDDIDARLREAAAVGIVERRGDTWRFRHVLLRDQLYSALQPSKRAELHRRAAELLESREPVRAAHHALAGVTGGADERRAVELARRAAKHAASVYAFEDAVELLEAALPALERSADAREALAIDLRLELADAQHDLGRAEAAHRSCVRAAELARARRDVERFARAALVYARELLSGTRDSVMIALLEEARDMLGQEDSAIRARVLARLGAALVPGPYSEILRAQSIAYEAVAIARRIADDETTMYVLRYAAHAHSYQISLDEAFAMSAEMIALSDKLGRPLEALDHRSWQISAYLGYSNLAAANAAFERYEALLAPLPQPHYRWRVPMQHAMWNVRTGDFDDADRRIEIVRAIAREHGLERARWASIFARLSVVAASRDRVRAEALVDDVRTMAVLGPFAGNFMSFVLAIAGRAEEANAVLDRTPIVPALVVGQFGCEAVVELGAKRHVEAAIAALEGQAALHPMVYGPQGSLIMPPSAHTLGGLYLLADRVDDAITALERGLSLSRAIEAPPYIATGAASLARGLASRGRSEDRARIRALEDEATRLAAAFHIPLSIERDASPPKRTFPSALAIRCDAEQARVAWNGREILMPRSKGFELLAQLIASPNQEAHVSDLIGDDDRGDAGEVLDAKARASYRQRAEELRADLEEARARNDLGHAERLAAELEAITDELLAGTGLGGRARKAGSRVERARVNVQRRIKDAVRRLAAEDPALGRYLEATIRTGTFCSFVPFDT